MDARALRILLAFAIGLLIGTERERRRRDQSYYAFAGVRTFGLIGLLGGVLGYLAQPALTAVGAGFVGLLALVAHVVNHDAEDRGITTEVAMAVTYALGLTAVVAPAVAAAAGVVVTVVLALRAPLHKAVLELMSEAELRDVLLFLVVSLVLLPVAPDVHVGPFGAIHPPSLARLVALLMFVNGLGHIARRLWGARFGLTVAGLAGGFVSSSATIAAMSMRAKQNPAAYRGAVAGALSSCVSTSAQYALIVAALDPSLVPVVAFALGASATVAVLITAAFAVPAAREPSSALAPEGPFKLSVAAVFVTVYCVVSIVASALRDRFGAAGIVMISAAAGFVDAHSTAGSIASLHRTGELDSELALLASLAALSANSVLKVVLAWSGRTLRFGAWTTFGVVSIALAAWSALLLR